LQKSTVSLHTCNSCLF